MIELLNRLAAADPELCKPTSTEGFYAIHTTVSLNGWWGINGIATTGSDLAILQFALQQAIEARGWEYEHRYFAEPIGPRHKVIIMLGRDAGHLAPTAAEALLAAYVAAVESEER